MTERSYRRQRPQHPACGLKHQWERFGRLAKAVCQEKAQLKEYQR